MASEPMSQSESLKPFDVDDLAQEIRRVDGSNSLGAGALAEALVPFIVAAWNRRPSTADRGGTVEVKALEWITTKALNNGRKLVALDCFRNEFARLDLTLDTTDEQIAKFKAAAQADYTARIRFALATTAGEATGARPREELIVAISEELKHHDAFDGKPMAQLVWASRIYDNVLAAPSAALVTDKG